LAVWEGGILCSRDGKNWQSLWTARAEPVMTELSAIAHSDQGYVAVERVGQSPVCVTT